MPLCFKADIDGPLIPLDQIEENKKLSMEGPLLTKSGHNVDVTIHGDSSSNDEHIVDITINGSSDEQTPRESVQWSVQSTNRCVWILVEFVMTLFQIVAAIFFCTLTKDEQNPELEEYWFIWIIGYTCASIATLPLLCWRLWHCSETRYKLCDLFLFF